MDSLIKTFLRFSLALTIFLSSLSKLIFGHSENMFTPKPLFYFLSGAELLMALSLIANYSIRTVTAAICALSCSGILVALFSSRPCGCLGRGMEFRPEWHATFASIIGVIALWLFYETKRPEADRSH